MMILVTGATGHVGRAVVSRLASAGHDVVAMVRDAPAARGRLPSGIALRVADYEDVSALKRAFTGVDEMVLISSDGDADAVMRHHANAIEAAVAAGIGHITFTSIIDTDESSPFCFAPVYRDAERRLAACGVPSTVLRCGLYWDFVLDHWLVPCRSTGELALPAGEGRVAPISRDDVAAAVAAIAATSDKSRVLGTLTGNLALGFGEIANFYGETIGRPLRYRPCSTGEYLASAATHLDDPWPHAFATLCASIAEGFYNEVSDDFIAVTGHEPGSFQDFLRRATPAASG